MKANDETQGIDFSLIRKVAHAMIFFSDDEQEYVISLLDKGGPIIRDSSLENAKIKFQTAMKLSSSIRNFLYYKGATKSSTQKTRRFYTDKLKERFDRIEYHEMVA